MGGAAGEEGEGRSAEPSGLQGPAGCDVLGRERPGARRDRGQLQACGFGGRREQGSQAELGGEDRLDGWREDSEVWGSLTCAGGSTPAPWPWRLPSRDLCLLTCEMEAGRQGPPSLPPCDSPPRLLPPGDPQLHSPAQGKALGSPRRLACWGDPGPGAGRTPRPPSAPGPPPCLLLPQLSWALSPGADGASCVAG